MWLVCNSSALPLCRTLLGTLFGVYTHVSSSLVCPLPIVSYPFYIHSKASTMGDNRACCPVEAHFHVLKGFDRPGETLCTAEQFLDRVPCLPHLPEHRTPPHSRNRRRCRRCTTSKRGFKGGQLGINSPLCTGRKTMGSENVNSDGTETMRLLRHWPSTTSLCRASM